jgi:hypothetical protein
VPCATGRDRRGFRGTLGKLWEESLALRRAIAAWPGVEPAVAVELSHEVSLDCDRRQERPVGCRRDVDGLREGEQARSAAWLLEMAVSRML